MFLKDKFKLGEFERTKARLVVGGDYVTQQVAGETASPTVNPITVMMMINIAATEGMEISCHDIKGAFLLSELDPSDPDMYIRLDGQLAGILGEMRPQLVKFKDNRGQMYLKLMKYLYGLPQASQRFNKFLDARLKYLGFTPVAGDPCAYVRGKGADRVLLCIHVDDLLVCGQAAARAKFQSQFSKEKFEFTTQMGDKIEYLGMTIEKVPEGYRVSQDSYRQELISRFETDIKNYEGAGGSPAGEDLMQPSTDEEKVDRIKYLGMVMSTMYLARLTRADILFPTVYLATKSQSPTKSDYIKLCRVLKYVKKRANHGVTFFKDRGIEATLYTDASHGIHHDGKGHIGIIATLGSGYIAAKTSKIKMITLSSTESEQVALSEATTFARWMRRMLKDFGHEMKTPTKLFMDNKSAIWLTEKMGAFARNKHIMIRRNYTLEGVMDKVIKPAYMPTAEQPADMLTKDKPRRTLDANMKKIGLLPMEEQKD
jgi:hypothetical protein